MSFSKDPSTLDPRKASDYASSTLICLLFDGLTRCTSGSEIELAVAESLTVSQDEKTYLFKLKKTFWNDGTPLTAQDFENSWKTILTPGFPSPCAYLLYPIKNGEKYAKGLCSIQEVGIHALDHLTLKIELEHPTPYFLHLTAFPLFLPFPPHQTGDILISNGPFCLEKIQIGSEIVLKKNPLFRNPEKVHIDTIDISIITNDVTAFHLFEKGELDLVGGPFSPIGFETLPPNFNHLPISFLPMAASTFCAMNTQTFPFCNQTIRKAFRLAIGDKLKEEISNMRQIPATHLLPPSLTLQSLDPEEKEDPLCLFFQGLDELKIEEKDFPKVTLYYKPHLIEKKIAQALQQILEKTLPVSIELVQMEAKTLAQKLLTKNYQLSLTSWIAQFHDPINLLERFKDPSNGKNYAGWSSSEFQALLQKAAEETLNRSFHLKMAETLLEEASVSIPLFHWVSPLLVNPKVQGIEISDSGGVLIERSFITESESSVLHH